MMKRFITQTQTVIDQQNTTLSQHNRTLRELETQISQLVLNRVNRAMGTLLNNTEILKAPGKEHVKAITLRSGKDLGEPTFGPRTKTYFDKMSKSNNSTVTPTPTPNLGSTFQKTIIPVVPFEDAPRKKISGEWDRQPIL